MSTWVLSAHVSAYHLYSLWLWVQGLFIPVCWPLWWSGDLSRLYPASHPKAAWLMEGRAYFLRQIGFNEECGFFWIAAKECNMKSNTKHQLLNEMQKGRKGGKNSCGWNWGIVRVVHGSHQGEGKCETVISVMCFSFWTTGWDLPWTFESSRRLRAGVSSFNSAARGPIV